MTENTQNSTEFIKDVVKYFMDFLETDFHKRKNPRRVIKLRNEDNLVVGLNLLKYPRFREWSRKQFSTGLKQDLSVKVSKGVYTTTLPESLLSLIKINAEKITEKIIKEIRSDICEIITNNALMYNKEQDKALNQCHEQVTQVLKKKLVLPFITSIEKPIESLNLGDESNVFIIEEELTEILIRQIENKIAELINLAIAEPKYSCTQELKLLLDHNDVKNIIVSYFDSLSIGDLYTDLFELDKNKQILDKQELYLYFGEMVFDKVKFPIFYVPVELVFDNGNIQINFDSQLYINKKALEYISQEYNTQTESKGSLKTIGERILYLAQGQDIIKNRIDGILRELTDIFKLDNYLDLENLNDQKARSLLVHVNNNAYIGLFDKSDEALVNDYEEILKLIEGDDNLLGNAFNTLIDDFINKNPKVINVDISDEWDGNTVTDKLVYPSPIPLNSEQRQILVALSKSDCKYVTVEGPPGTGKSHTITAIIFNAILKNQSVLVLSDKKEALDVVEDKITSTMNKVRGDKNFQNPILRLGKTGNTYAQILSPVTLDNITTQYRAIRNDYTNLEANIIKTQNSIKEELEAELISYNGLQTEQILEFVALEKSLIDIMINIDQGESVSNEDFAFELEEVKSIVDKLVNVSENNHILSLFNLSLKSFKSIEEFKEFIKVLRLILDVITKLRSVYNTQVDYLKYFNTINSADIGKLDNYIKETSKLNIPIIGAIFYKDKLSEGDLNFKKNFDCIQLDTPHKELHSLRTSFSVLNYMQDLLLQLEIPQSLKGMDLVYLCHSLITKGIEETSLEQFVKLEEDVEYIKTFSQKYPLTSQKLNINATNFKSFVWNNIQNFEQERFDDLLRYLNLYQELKTIFVNLPAFSYLNAEKSLQELVTTQMTYIMDGRLVDFYNTNKSDAAAIRKIIKNKEQFPKNEFIKLKNAFPCILAGIRDYAEYIPLEPEMFDLLIIDEASQVSIAQAFPALLRAKKILILGDRKQFSNVKAAQARSDTNKEYLNGIDNSFRKNVSKEGTKIVKLQKFNIKTSILEFFEFISNYNTQLRKHFRGYKEIISYSNKYFYQDSLQVMKIRGKPIEEVIKLHFVEQNESLGIPNTNINEVKYIINELLSLKKNNITASVGIITPHTNQQKLLLEEIRKIQESSYFFDEMRLKIMTFDTCQGEERDVVYYSMVATKEEDHLWGVFIKDLNLVDIEEDGKIKAQRLNVGLSRAKETINFVLSKPIDEFSGSIGDAIRHYQYTLEEAKKEHSPEETDQKSGMEKEVLNWFYQTTFWKQNMNNGSTELLPQFEIGKYLRQLDGNYNHPNYKVDFLLVHKDSENKEHKIIIEYDGFDAHFINPDEVTKYNYQDYYSEGDLYREKVLESYGYKFLRINRFNIGENQVETLNERISSLVKERQLTNGFLENLHNRVNAIRNGQLKECPKCKQLRSLEDFNDSQLITGKGRFCKQCKNAGINFSGTIQKEYSNQLCPRCGAKMVLRRGRYGQFYGCSKYPYCKGTRAY